MSDLTLSEPSLSLNVSLEWKTEIARCDDIEFRRARRDTPRASVRWTSLVQEGDHLRFQDAWLDKTSVVTWFDWRYAQELSIDGTLTIITVEGDYWYPAAGDTVAVVAVDGTYETATIDTVVSDTVTLTGAVTISRGYVVPVLACELIAQPAFDFAGGTTVRVTVSMEITDYPDLSSDWTPTTTLDDVAVRLLPDWLQGSSTRKVDRGKVTFPGDEGPFLQDDRYTTPRQLNFISIKAASLSERFDEEAFIHYLGGMDIPFWKSTWLDDFNVDAAASSGASQISVLAASSSSTTPVAIHLPETDGYHEVTTVTPSGDSLLLDIDPVLAADVADGAVVHDLHAVRLGSDKVQLRYGEAMVCTAQIGVVEVPHDV